MADNNKEIDKFIGQITKIADLIQDRQVNLRLARKCREIVVRRVKSGKGVNADTKPAEETIDVKLKPLSQSYIDYRNGVAFFFTNKYGKVVAVYDGTVKLKNGKEVISRKKKTRIIKPKLGEFGRPATSNLTLTGQMFNSVVISSDETGFKLFIADTRRTDGKATNKQVAEWASKDRPFFALTAGEIRILQRELETIIKEIIERVSR